MHLEKNFSPTGVPAFLFPFPPPVLKMYFSILLEDIHVKSAHFSINRLCRTIQISKQLWQITAKCSEPGRGVVYNSFLDSRLSIKTRSCFELERINRKQCRWYKDQAKPDSAGACLARTASSSNHVFMPASLRQPSTTQNHRTMLSAAQMCCLNQ